MKFLLSAALLLSTTSISMANLIGLAYNSSTAQNEIRSVDPQSGSTTLLNSFTFSSGSSRAATFISDPLFGRAYVVSGDDKLYSFSLSSGALLAMPQIDTSFTAIDRAGNGQLVGINFSGSQAQFRSINPATGTTTLLNTFTFANGFSLGTFVADPSVGTAYALSGNQLYEFSLTSGAILATPTLTASVLGIGVGVNGGLIGLSQNGNPRNFLSIDPTTGTATVLATSNLPFLSLGGLKTDPSANEAYALTGSTLYDYNLSTGAVLSTATLDTSLQGIAIVPEPSSLAFLLSGVLLVSCFLGRSRIRLSLAR